MLEKDKSFGKQDTRVFGQKKAKAEISRIHRLKIINKKHLICDNKKKTDFWAPNKSRDVPKMLAWQPCFVYNSYAASKYVKYRCRASKHAISDFLLQNLGSVSHILSAY